ncbi:MAG: TIM barrel protein [Patescibacteria group bacterium]|nr:TIM barrel protein [Patescibacteria group bacterium]
MLIPRQFSVGGWCLVSGGSDPFGDPTRGLPLEVGLEGCVVAGIKFISFHDRDLWGDDASEDEITQKIGETLDLVKQYGLSLYNFTSNLFSNTCFRSGAFSSPFPQVREAAIVKACRSMDVAAQMGAKNVIFWGGREGSDGAYEQDMGLGLRRYIEGIKICVDYALEKGYDYKVTIETKVYEPRLLALFAGTGASASSAIQKFFPDPKYKGRILINPEYPQHVAMLGLDPVVELGQLLEEGVLAPFLHFGGQIPARMDCDLPPGVGSSLTADFMICNLLNERNWDGIIEFDCKPMRTTTTPKGMKLFLKHSVVYWKMLEKKVALYQSDPIITKIKAELNQPESAKLKKIMAAVQQDMLVVPAVKALTASFSSFDAVSDINTDAIEAHIYRTLQILSGIHEEGAVMFEGTRWST